MQFCIDPGELKLHNYGCMSDTIIYTYIIEYFSYLYLYLLSKYELYSRSYKLEFMAYYYNQSVNYYSPSNIYVYI